MHFKIGRPNKPSRHRKLSYNPADPACASQALLHALNYNHETFQSKPPKTYLKNRYRARPSKKHNPSSPFDTKIYRHCQPKSLNRSVQTPSAPGAVRRRPAYRHIGWVKKIIPPRLPRSCASSSNASNRLLPR